ncbi:MAG: hypothetical protein ACREEH_02325, partial [Caulobacteraceae bacterium]
MKTVTEIPDRLASMPSGEIPGDLVRELERFLASRWDRLTGSRVGGMSGSKLIGRTEDMEWSPPILAFGIERHGALVNGSSRAELQRWRVDLGRGEAELVQSRRRQIFPADARLNVKPIAAEIAALIREGGEDPRIKRRGAEYVRIVLSEVIPTTVKQTTTG